MHLKKRSSGASNVRGARIRGAAEAMLGTDTKGQNSMYDTRSGTFLTIILLFVLGWIPMIGQGIAGFIGGRRAGSPMRGLTASVLGTVTVIAIMFFAVEGLRAVNSAIISDPEGEIAAIASSYPVVEQILDAALGYARGLFGNADFTIDLAPYALTIPFGIIGGIVSDQSQKEARLIVESTGKVNARRIRSLDAYRNGTTLGFECFEQYSAMSVNTMSTNSNRTVKNDDGVASPKKAPVRSNDTPVTATVDTTRVQSTTTSSIETPRKKKDPEGETTVLI